MNKKVVVTLFAALFALSIFAMIPTITSEHVKTIKIGVIAASTAGLDTTIPLIKEIVEPDINAYCAKLPMFRFLPRTQFEFLIEDAQSSPAIHLEKVQMFHEMGVDLIIGGGWSSQAAGSLDYMNENGMLLISWSSTAPQLAIPNDNLFRLASDDTVQGRIIAKMMLTRGVENAIVFYRNDIWGDGLYAVFETEYSALGGSILGALQYDTEETDFTAYLQEADDIAEGMDNLGVLFISYAEGRTIIRESINYPNIYNPPWFGTESAGRSEATLNECPDQAVHLKIYSALSAPPDSPKYLELNERYQDLTGYTASYYTATLADAAWIVAQAVLETKPSVSPQFDATDVIRVLPEIAWRHYGYSGYCLLNEAGDRVGHVFDIWGYTDEDGYPWFKKYGTYDGHTDELTWYG